MDPQKQIENGLHPQELEFKTTPLRTSFNGLNALSGLGILSISHALSEAGWLSLTLLFLVAAICYYTAILMQRCMDSDPLIRTYPDIGQLAFGKKGRYAISAFMYLELYLVLVEFLILEGDNLHKLFPNVHIQMGKIRLVGKQIFILLPALIILPMTWCRSLGLLAYVSLSGVLSSFVLLISVLWVGEFGGVGFHEEGSVWKWSGLPTTISLYTFCYCGHAIFPTLSDSMRDRNQFPKVLLFCFGVSTFTYGSMAVLGYMMFGDSVKSQVTLNLPDDKISSKIAIYTTLVNPITKYPIYIIPIAKAMEDGLHFRNQRAVSVVIRTGLVASNVVLALSIPFFDDVMKFIGAFLSVGISMLFPCLCYLKIKQAYKKVNVELVFIVLIMILGVFVSVAGTYVSVTRIIGRMKWHQNSDGAVNHAAGIFFRPGLERSEGGISTS